MPSTIRLPPALRRGQRHPVRRPRQPRLQESVTLSITSRLVSTLTAPLAEVFLWSDDSNDANGASPASSKALYDQIASSYPAPHLVLNHETVETTHTQVMPYAVPLLKNRGYQLVSVDTCLGSNGEWPYTWVGQPGVRDSTWHC